ncbi:MAG: VOC family protein [Pseudomonadota bacterium]
MVQSTSHIHRAKAFWLAQLTVLAVLVITQAAIAAPVAEDERIDLDLRRTTLVVRDIEQSLKFYRDALGMEVIYDRDIITPSSAKSDEEAERARQLVFLRANDDFIGVLGLLQYRKPLKQPVHQGLEPFTPGSMVLLFNTGDLKSRFAAAAATEGTRVLSKPSLTRYPGYDGSGTIEVMVSVLTDPDGFVVELNQVLSGL